MTTLTFILAGILLLIPAVISRSAFQKKLITQTERVGLENQRALVQRIYTAELGVRETAGRNDGEQVETYLRYVKLNTGNPWCAAFVCWVFGQAGVDNPRSGWSPALFPQATLVWNRIRLSQIQNQVRNSPEAYVPQRGDVFGIWFADKQRIAHVGFVDSWSEDWVITVEGNTNEAGSSEGDGVYRKRRLTRSLWQVAKWVEGRRQER